MHFSTHLGSRKGQHLAGTPFASVTFYWRETLQQITVAGPVERRSDQQSTALFAERTLAAQATTAVSHQSQPLEHEHLLHQQAAELIDAGKPLPRPDGWAGYRHHMDQPAPATLKRRSAAPRPPRGGAR